MEPTISTKPYLDIPKLYTKLNENILPLQSAALEAAADGIVITDIEGTIIWVNSGFTKLTGYSAEEAITKNPRILKSGMQNEGYYKAIWDTILSGKTWFGEIINKRKNGEIYTEEMSITPVKNNRNEITNFIAIKHNISNRKKLERELKDSYYRFKQLFQNSTLGIVRFDENDEILMLNPAFVKMLGYENENEIICKAHDEIYVSPETRKNFLDTLKTLNKISQFEELYFKKDGSIIELRENAWTVKDENDKLIYYEAIIEDITEQNKFLKILHESEFRYRMLIDKLSEAAYLLVGRKFEMVNKKFLELLEVTKQDIDDPNFNMMDYISEESKALVIDRELKIRKGEIIPTKYEMRIVTKSRKEKDVEVSVSYINIDGKNATQGIIRDLTEKKRNETQIRHLQKMEAIGALAAGIAHEINTPAQFLNDNLHFLSDVFNDFKPIFDFLLKAKNEKAALDDLIKIIENIDLVYINEEIPNAISQSLKGLERISNIVGAMRDFSHAGPKEKVAADLHKLIQNSIIISKNAWKYVAELDTDFDNTIPHVVCQSSDLGQVFVNMIVNASHAIESRYKGESNINGKIIIKTANKNESVEIIISDNGSGIPSNIQDRIFEPFFTTKEVGKGTGQGLAISYDIIVNKHKGSIHVQSEENIGTSFIISLPIENENKVN